MEESAGEPQKDIIEATFKINYSRWLSLCAPGRSVAFQIYSNDNVDSRTEKGMASEKVYLKHGKVMDRAKLPLKRRGRKINLPWKIMEFKLKFEVGRGFGIPGAILVENKDKHEFFLESAILHYIKKKQVQDRHFYFDCKSWVYPLHQTGAKRLYLPNETPAGLKKLREKQLQKLRGERLKSSSGERKPWDRIYEYDYYNDLGDPDNDRQYARPVLGGGRHPYPRRLRTGRPRCHDDPESESRSAGCFEIYVPPDERLSHQKMKELENNLVDALARFLTPKAGISTSHQDFSIIGSNLNMLRGKAAPSPSSKSHEESRPVKDMLLELFSDKPFGKEMEASVKEKLKKLVPHHIYNKVVASATKKHPVYSQLPSIIEADCFRSAESDKWLTDEEFVRQLLAGTNPVAIRRLKTVEEFPSKLKQRLFLGSDDDETPFVSTVRLSVM
ncbi:Lipoxygenase [Corchorus olitorius]|uniref:Lipoxygenase n=1 Tax=Corchorus olitorius TaxID=93759 RepID=A0A1R3G9C3_9ROSI|nr:Lipoxygenase [Corchorus olitorius]